MTFAIAAAGTGGHVYPGLAVAEALVRKGISSGDIVFFGGDRMEATTVPAAGFPFVGLELQGLVRAVSLRNLRIPAVVIRASRAARAEMQIREVRATLCMGGYVTVPVGRAATNAGSRLLIHEQNAHAGLANRVMSRWADRVFLTFPNTTKLSGEIIGNPLRSQFVDFDEQALRPQAVRHFNLDPQLPILGVFGGSLGAGVINDAVSAMATDWEGPPMQIIHLLGRVHESSHSTAGDAPGLTRRLIGFEERMDLFYAAADLAVARAGGSLFEVAASGTPAIVVPGSFGGGHQRQNAQAMVEAGAATLVTEAQLSDLGRIVGRLLADRALRRSMEEAARRVARPRAADVVADAMMEAADV